MRLLWPQEGCVCDVTRNIKHVLNTFSWNILNSQTIKRNLVYPVPNSFSGSAILKLSICKVLLNNILCGHLSKSTGQLKYPNGSDGRPLKYISIFDTSMNCNYISTNTLICKIQTLIFNLNICCFLLYLKKYGCDKLFCNS